MRTRMLPSKKHALNPNRWPKPKRKYSPRVHLDGRFDPTWTLNRSRLRPKFETLAGSRREDRLRAKHLEENLDREATVLGKWLQQATDAKELPLALISSVYWQAIRLRLTALIARDLHTRHGQAKVLPFTIASTKWRILPRDLATLNPARIKNMLRSMLVSCGVEAADGIVIAGLHGEYDGQFYILHFHGIALGDKAVVIRALKKRADLKRNGMIYRPLRFGKPIPVDNIPLLLGWLTYCFQPFWPFRPIYVGPDGKPRRSRKKRRLPVAEEVRVLKWLATATFADCRLINGISL
jgi:hypothetical protein